MKRVVAKFGGSSLADSHQFKKMKKILEADPSRELVVVSAPGKMEGNGHKITDMLYMCVQLASHHLNFTEVYNIIEKRYQAIARDLHLKTDITAALAETKSFISQGESPEKCVSRGEYMCALLAADYLGFELVDAADLIRFNEDGTLNQSETYRLLREKLPAGKKAVIPGFYGADEQGNLYTFARGGSDITGALVAQGIKADLYENWTDVSGFLMADPKVVPNPQPIEMITYKELRELSYMGAQVLQEEAIFPVREAGISIHIKNTNDPDSPGTLILPELPIKKKEIITGIAGKKDFSVIAVEKMKMRSHTDFMRKLISVFESNDVVVEHMPSSIDSLSVIVSERELKAKEKKILEEVRIYCSPDSIETWPSIALIAVVGHGMIHTPGVSARVFGALSRNGINVRMISQGASELNILVGVANSDFEAATRAIYYEFTGAKK